MRSTKTSATKAVIAALAIICSMSIASAACLGVSRTININSFKSTLGMGPGGSMGLRHKEVVLTFDDGPVPKTTSRILSALKAECTKATFFVVGRMAAAHPSTLQKVARDGHTIAHHTHTHDNLQSKSLGNSRNDIRKGVAVTRRALGRYSKRSTKLFRYPYLSRNSKLDKVLRREGLIPVSASVLSQDWRPGSASSVVDRVMSRLNSQGRGVILLHDIQVRTANALPTLLRRLKAGGYKVVHLRSGRSRSTGPVVAKIDTIKTGSIKKASRKKSRAKSKPRSKTASRTTKKKSMTLAERKRAESLARSKKLRAKNAKKKKGGGLFSLLAKQNKARSKKLAKKTSGYKKQ